eukprot:TRINITY_DN8881_c0_g1_i3.p1 TRINITY_DN8881_c0_g1~~TRINITY_DN8881_c0_g1_i3.p1  ORF type:complete len:410 (+),score=145.96 TRINITY_DN8881_c0_g1_i3:148-1377(+)
MPIDGPLHKAAGNGSLREIEQLVKEGADINAPGANDRTALHKAAGYGHAAAVSLLLKLGADVKARDRQGRSPLHWGAVGGSKEVVEALLAANVDINDKATDNGSTALHTAAANKKFDVIELLVKKGADRSIKDNNNKTAHEVFKETFPDEKPPSELDPSKEYVEELFKPESSPHATLRKLLQDRKGKALFYSFLRSNFAEENFQLYNSLQQLAALPTFDEKLAKAEEIQGQFLSISSQHAAFLPEEIIRNFCAATQQHQEAAFENSFKTVEEAIFQQLLDIFISSFSTSPEYKEFLVNPNFQGTPVIPRVAPDHPATSSSHQPMGLVFGGGDINKCAKMLGIGAPVRKGFKDVDVDAIIRESEQERALEKAAEEKKEESEAGQASAPVIADESSSDSDAYLLDSDDDEE